LSTALGKQLTAVEHGSADLMQSLPAARMHEITTRYAAQVHVFPYSQTAAIVLNTRLPPFDKLAARRAFAYAIDRSKVVAGYGGAEGAAATCQILPTEMPGYRPYCPYTAGSRAGNGSWAGPDLIRARKLVAESGTRGAKVVLWTRTAPLQLAAGKIAVAALDRIGYRASLKPIAGDRYFGEIADSRNRVQAAFDAWSQDYPAPSNFLTQFACSSFRPASPANANKAGICDARLDRAITHALTEQTSGYPNATNRAWAAVDRLVTDLAPWVAMVNPRTAVVVSRRVHNLQANTQSGVLIDQISVR
jgi:peptide/nickel transport system substrate-binding protein